MKYTPSRPLNVGAPGSTTIAQTNVTQSLVTTQTLVRSLQIYPGPSNSGTLLFGYNGEPTMPVLNLPPNGNTWYDLALVRIKGTAGDTAVWQQFYKP